MSGPAKAGVFIYAKNMERLARFYREVLLMSELHQSNELTVLQSPDIQLLIHATPEETASAIVIEQPPVLREKSALKFFFTVPSLSTARSSAASLGGAVLMEQWQGPGFVVCNACDPEGNIFQVRESLP